MRAGSISERTIVDRLGVLRRVAASCGDPVTATSADLAGFLARPMGTGTRATYFATLRALYRYLVVTGRRDDDPTVAMRAPRLPRGVPHPITTKDLQRLLATGMRRRTRTMILLAAYQGLRVHEIAKLRGEDVDSLGRILRVTGKGGVSARLPLHPLVAEQATMYPRRGWWFPTRLGNSLGVDGPIHARSVSTLIANAMARAGVQGTPHSLRHWHGTELVRAGNDLQTVRTMLRHSSLQTTQIYVAVAGEGLDAAIRSLPDYTQEEDSA